MYSREESVLVYILTLTQELKDLGVVFTSQGKMERETDSLRGYVVIYRSVYSQDTLERLSLSWPGSATEYSQKSWSKYLC